MEAARLHGHTAMTRVRIRQFYTIGDLAKMVDLSVSTVRRDVQLGELRAVKRRGRGYYWVSAADARDYVVRMGCRWEEEAAS